MTPPLDDADKYEDAHEPWMRPSCEADLYRMDLRAEEAQRRADRTLAKVLNVALCRKSAERTWDLIVKNLPPLRYR